MGSNIKNLSIHQDVLKILANPKNKYSKIILAHADSKLINTISEIIYNVVKQNIEIPESDKKELLKFRTILLKLIHKGSLREKRKILSQKGGFLQFILPAVITGLASIVSSAISK